MHYNKYLVIGGDLRSVALTNHLIADGKKVKVFGMAKQIGTNSAYHHARTLHESLENVEIILGPIPCCSNNNVINAPFHEESELQGAITVDALFKAMKPGQIFIAGFISESVIQLAKPYNITIVDILKRDEMAILNAIPTAEGAIQIAFTEMKITLHDANAMVLGYGRIGKILCKMLHGIGANVHCVARQSKDIASIKSFGYTPLYFSQLSESLGKMDVIFNTVPHIILDKSNVKYIQKDCVIIDVASRPFGIDFEASKQEGLKVMWASSLPGKVAPISAAKYIQESVYNVLSEMEG